MKKLPQGGEKLIIYVGDSGDIKKRTRTHCSDNIEGSAFRKLVAEAKGYRIKSTRRNSGSMKYQIDKTAEMEVSNYIRSGMWRYVICAEAKDFQWYVIDQLKPLLNKDRKTWEPNNLQRYQSLMVNLTSSPALDCDQLRKMQSGSGVYVFYHQERP